jgi:hypothetical protein
VGEGELFILSCCRLLGGVGCGVGKGISVYWVCHGLGREDVDGEKNVRREGGGG